MHLNKIVLVTYWATATTFFQAEAYDSEEAARKDLLQRGYEEIANKAFMRGHEYAFIEKEQEIKV